MTTEAEKNIARVSKWRNAKREEGLLTVQIVLRPETVNALKALKKQDSSLTYSNILEAAFYEMMNKKNVVTRKAKKNES